MKGANDIKKTKGKKVHDVWKWYINFLFTLHYQIFMKEILLLKLPSIKLANCCVGYFVNGNLLLKSDFNMIVS